MVELALDLKGFQMARPREPLLGKFLAKFRVNSETNCWQWTAAKAGRYGAFRSDTRMDLAHRVSYEIYCGPIPAGLRVCHRCDNPICVNPEHLFLGTDADNVFDKVSKSRQARGISHGHCKLSDSDVIEIRKTKGATQQKIADLYGVDRTLIGLIRRNKIWKHLPRTEDAGDLL